MLRRLFAMRGPTSSSRRGFTIIELIVVLAIVAILASLAVSAIRAVSRRGTLSVAHKTIATAFDQARAHAVAHASDVVFVVAGNTTPAKAAACGAGTRTPELDDRCVRYWLLEDVSSGPGTRFDAAALGGFDPQNPASLGDVVLASGSLGSGVMIGTAPGYVPVQPVAGSIFEGVALSATKPCSFCQAPGAPLRGFIRFGSDGRVSVSGDPRIAGAFLAFTGVAADGAAIPTTNYVVLSAPGGLVAERLSRSGK